MIHYCLWYFSLQGGIGQTLCSFEHVSCKYVMFVRYNSLKIMFVKFRPKLAIRPITAKVIGRLFDTSEQE